MWHGAGDLSIADKFLDDNSENLYGEPHPSRMGVRHARRIVVKVCAPAGPPTSQQGGAAAATASGLYSCFVSPSECPEVSDCQHAPVHYRFCCLILQPIGDHLLTKFARL